MLARLIILLVLVSPVVIATLWFSDNPGAVRIEWLGWQVDTNISVLLLSLLLLFSALLSLYRLSAVLADLPARFGHSRKARVQEKGMAALLAALDAVAAGELGEGRQRGAEAAKLLRSPALAASLDRLMPRPESPPPSPAAAEIRPDQGKKRGKPAPKEAVPPSPPSPPPAPVAVVHAPPPVDDPTPFHESLRAAAWDQALAQVEAALVSGAISPPTAARRRAATELARAMAEEDGENSLRLARDAVKTDAGFLPAALHLLRLHVAAGRSAEAESVLAAAWKHTPSALLLEACRGLWAGDDAEARLARLERLAENNPNHQESHLAIGEVAVAAERWGLARRHLVAAAKAAPSAMASRLMVVVEEREAPGSANAAEVWRRKEAEAPPAPAWRCGACGAVQAEWSVSCPACSGVMTVDWG